MIGPEQLATLQELLDDAERCPRLSDWDESFLADVRGRVGRYGPEVRITERQAAALKSIEAKVYASG